MTFGTPLVDKRRRLEGFTSGTARAVPPSAVLFVVAAGAVLGGTYLWAWLDEDFWQPVPVSPCVAAAGLLSIVGLAGAAIVTLGRWEF